MRRPDVAGLLRALLALPDLPTARRAGCEQQLRVLAVAAPFHADEYWYEVEFDARWEADHPRGDE